MQFNIQSNYSRAFHRVCIWSCANLAYMYFILYRFQCRHTIKGITFRTPKEEWGGSTSNDESGILASLVGSASLISLLYFFHVHRCKSSSILIKKVVSLITVVISGHQLQRSISVANMCSLNYNFNMCITM